MITIAPESINPLTLPSVLLVDRRHLPKHQGIYFVVDGDDILYIGKAANLAQRWKQHQRWYQLKDRYPNSRIAWLECSDADLLPNIEAALIDCFEPKLNERKGIVIVKPSKGVRWRLRVLMAEKNITNKELAERSGVHRVSISKLKQTDEVKQITGDVLNRLCNGLTAAYQARGEDVIITPGDLLEYTPDLPEDAA